MAAFFKVIGYMIVTVLSVAGALSLAALVSDPIQPTDPASMRFKQPAYDTGTDYRLNGPFINDDSFVYHNRNLLIYREEPVISLSKTTVSHLCVSSFNTADFDVDITLESAAREHLLASFREAPTYHNASIPTRFHYDGEKRYFLEGDGNRITFFWVSPDAANAYASKLEKDPATPDMRLTVPLGQLSNFQFYLINSLADAPLSGCSPNIDATEIPGWQEIVEPFWRDVRE